MLFIVDTERFVEILKAVDGLIIKKRKGRIYIHEDKTVEETCRHSRGRRGWGELRIAWKHRHWHMSKRQQMVFAV